MGLSYAFKYLPTKVGKFIQVTKKHFLKLLKETMKESVKAETLVSKLSASSLNNYTWFLLLTIIKVFGKSTTVGLGEGTIKYLPTKSL